MLPIPQYWGKLRPKVVEPLPPVEKTQSHKAVCKRTLTQACLVSKKIVRSPSLEVSKSVSYHTVRIQEGWEVSHSKTNAP